MTLEDVDAVHSYQSLPEVAEYQLFEPRSREAVLEKVTGFASALRLESDGDYLQVAVEESGRLIGDVYFAIKSVDNLCGEIGWTFHPDAQGRGFATEAARAMLELGFGLGLHRVVAELDPRNAASVALCLRLGMRHEAHFVEDMMFKGSWADTGVYALLAREWAAR
ncbi:N-acetyltransferase [Glaciihabitans arcticus]|uniref:N-acetyltransferase n=2 Tax=Glaciihabitans arcticus TaxID=2668039 RepID=A0A4Q9GUR7_9MICO|nr:N-acetyltransferase [Glaciihabitans arcticus]